MKKLFFYKTGPLMPVSSVISVRWTNEKITFFSEAEDFHYFIGHV
jgi:hypothetical protein